MACRQCECVDPLSPVLDVEDVHQKRPNGGGVSSGRAWRGWTTWGRRSQPPVAWSELGCTVARIGVRKRDANPGKRERSRSIRSDFSAL